MRLHEVQGPEPGKLARAFPVQRSLAEGHGYSKDLMPKAALSLSQTGIKPGSIKQVRALAVQYFILHVLRDLEIRLQPHHDMKILLSSLSMANECLARELVSQLQIEGHNGCRSKQE